MDNPNVRTYVPDPFSDMFGLNEAEYLRRQLKAISLATQRLNEALNALEGHAVDQALPQGGGATRQAIDAAGQLKHERTDAEQAVQDGRLDTVEAEKIGPPWKQNQTYGNLYPEQVGGETPGIGTIDNPIYHALLGNQGTEGSEGAVVARDLIHNGGLHLLGIRGLDPDNPPVPPYEGNAIVEVNGLVVLVTGGGLYIEVEEPNDTDHELIAQPAQLATNGKYYSHIALGPEKVYAHRESAENPNDVEVLNSGEVEIVTLTLVNNYTADRSTFSFSITLENLGNHDTLFTVYLKLDGITARSYDYVLRQNSQIISDSFAIDNSVTAGQIISLDVSATSTGPQSQGWVRGPTRIEIAQS